MLTAIVQTHTSPFVVVGVGVPPVAGAAIFSSAEEARLSEGRAGTGTGAVGSTGGVGHAGNVRSIAAALCCLAAVGRCHLWADRARPGLEWNQLPAPSCVLCACSA